MGFVPLAMLNNAAAKEYYLSKIYPIFRELIERSIFANYTKHYVDKTLMQITQELSLFISENKNNLSKSEKNYINGLNNLTKQFKRYVREKHATTYPVAVINLTTTHLEKFINELSKNKGIRPEIIFFMDPLYQSLFNITQEKALSYNGLKYNELIEKEPLNISKEEIILLNAQKEENTNKKKNKSFFNWF